MLTQQNIIDKIEVPRQKQKIFRSLKKTANFYYSDECFVAFDTETTGLHTRSDYLLEIGAIKFYFNSNKIQTFSQLVKPPICIPSFISNLTHIDNKMVYDKPFAKDVLPSFLDFIGGKQTILVAHNAPFDLGILNSELYRMNLPPLANLTVDTLPLARWAYPQIAGAKGTYSLQSLAKRFNIKVEQAHRAQDDARVCMELFKKIVKDTLCKQKEHCLQLELPF